MTKEKDSIVSSTGTSFDDDLVQQCYDNVDSGFQYTTYRDCDRLRGVSLMIQYNFTGLHTAPLFHALAVEALARSTSNDPNTQIKATINPLPITQIEKGFGGADDSLLVWFLVRRPL